MFNVIKTRAAVSILEWVTSFFFCTLQRRTTGRPASSWHRFRILFFFFQSDGNFSCVKWGFFGEKLEDICAY